MSNICFNPLAWAIKPLYDKAIAEDSDFAKEVKEKESRAEKPKSLSECADYILGEAFEWASNHRDGNMGYAGLPDDEMINLIKHYYDEDNIEIKKVNARSSFVGGADSAPKPNLEKKAEQPKKAKVIKIKRPKETISAGLTPMIRPKDEKDAKKGSREQAKSVVVMDMFAGLWGDDEQKKEAVVDDDGLPL